MKTLVVSTLLVVPWLSALACGIASAAELPDTVQRVKPSIVGVGTVQNTRRPPGRFVGTGFVVGDGHHVITNAHNLPETLDTERKEFLAIVTAGNRGPTRRAAVVVSDPVHDLALLRFEGRAMPALRLGDSRQVREGELYAFTGFPIGLVLGMYPVTHRGIVSAITPIVIPQRSASQLSARMVKQLRDPYDVFQLDATAYPGNSGSPLYDPKTGVVVGVINKVFVKQSKENLLKDPSGITYAIPASYAAALMSGADLDGR